MPHGNRPFVVHIDALGRAVVAVLSKMDEYVYDNPFQLISRTLQLSELNYITYQLETLVVVSSLEKFRHYMLFGPFNTYSENH